MEILRSLNLLCFTVVIARVVTVTGTDPLQSWEFLMFYTQNVLCYLNINIKADFCRAIIVKL